MSKRLVDIDDGMLRAAQGALGTRTIKETVNEALSRAVAAEARGRMLRRLRAGGLPDLRDPDVMAGAWR